MIQPNPEHLAKVAEKHWSELETTLKRRVENQIKETSDSKNKALLNALKNDNYKFLKRIVISYPHALEAIGKEIEENDTFDKFSKVEKKTDKDGKVKEVRTLTPTGKSVSKIFDYESFTRKPKKQWDAYDLARELNIHVCLYCNRQYTFTIGRKDENAEDEKFKEKITRPEFDHFFPKSKYPYLALSFYNLIPSCHICNGTLKLAIDFNTKEFLHPYLKGFGKDACFTTVPASYEDLIGEVSDNEDDLKILLQVLTLNKNLKKQINSNTVVFKLDEIYTEHRDYVREMIRKRVLNNDRYLQNLANQFEELFDGKEELYRLAFGNYLEEKDFTNRPLAKLTKDIAEELGMLD